MYYIIYYIIYNILYNIFYNILSNAQAPFPPPCLQGAGVTCKNHRQNDGDGDMHGDNYGSWLQDSGAKYGIILDGPWSRL